jgi:HK97 gp10 family phage protein
VSTIDTSELQKLSANLGRASGAVIRDARQVIAKAALNIKTDTREHISDNAYWKRLAHTVNYEQVGLWAKVGYDDVGQGELAGIYEFGSAKRDPHPTLIPAFDREAPRFEKAMGDLAQKAIEL